MKNAPHLHHCVTLSDDASVLGFFGVGSTESLSLRRDADDLPIHLIVEERARAEDTHILPPLAYIGERR